MHSENRQAATPITPTPMNLAVVFGVPLVAMCLLTLFEPAHLDLWLADLMYQPGTGFIGTKSFFLEDILHDRLKQITIAVATIALAVWLLSFLFPARIQIERKRWLYVVVAMVIASSLVTPLKRLTAVHCPWSLSRYGGVETYSPLMSKRAPAVEKAGQCWPAGHASAGFTLFALFFALRDIRPRAARWALASALALGSALSVGRMLQGAHFLSHGIWTALIDWTVCALFYRLMLYPAAPATAMAHTDNQCTAS